VPDGAPIIFTGTAMTNQILEAIETDAGTLYGRDTIYLVETSLQYSPIILTLKGFINLPLKDAELNYTLTFRQILALSMLELDSWDKTAPKVWYENPSCFVEVKNSEWIAALGGKISTKHHKHYILATYDEVFQIVCESIHLNIEL
jgi:hypothetical protein